MKTDKILLDHGSGGLATKNLIEDVFMKRLSNPFLSPMEDSAVLDLPPGKLAFTTDSFVIDPIFFPGGDIGSLAVHGTVNDLSMQGARPVFLSLGLILEEGLEIKKLEKIAQSVADAAKEAGVTIATADTKVVEKGQADKIFINTSGIGIIENKFDRIGIDRARPGDAIIVSGYIGDHGASILLARSGLPFEAEIQSDSAPLNTLVEDMLRAVPSGALRLLRDPTRGGVATVLNEIAQASDVDLKIEEDQIPIRKEVQGVCELLGLDPLYLANEGKCIVVVDKDHADDLLNVMKQHGLGRDAAIIGHVEKKRAQQPKVVLQTTIGGLRIVPILTGEPLPRIC